MPRNRSAGAPGSADHFETTRSEIRWRGHPGGPALVRTRFRARRLGRAVGWELAAAAGPLWPTLRADGRWTLRRCRGVGWAKRAGRERLPSGQQPDLPGDCPMSRIRAPAHQDPLAIRTMRSESDGESIPGGPALVRTRFGLAGLAALWVGTGGLPLVRSGPPYELMADGPYAGVEV